MPADHPVPAPSELVFTPRPSWGAPALAAGAMLIVIGIFAEGFLVRGWVYMIAGVVVALLALRSLVFSGVREYYERPRRQQPATAVLPAGTLRPPTSKRS